MNRQYSSPVAVVDQVTEVPTIGGRELSDKSEQVALGLLLNHRGDITDMLADLPRTHFADPCHQVIYGILAADPTLDPNARGIAIVRESALPANRPLRSRGDVASYVGQLMRSGEGDFGYHAKQVREAAVKREVLVRLEELTTAARMNNWSLVTDRLEAALETVATSATGNTVGVRLTSARSFKMKGVRWLWKGRIPAGMMTVLAGREGIGKSTVSLDIAARLTRGTLEGRYFGKPQNVILCATEDSWEHTIRPRLEAVNADLDKVFHIAVQDESGGFRAITAPGDIKAIEKAIAQTRPALMVIDPVMAIIDGKIDTHIQAQVQQGLEPLVKLCERAMMSVLGLIHVNKSTTTDALNSVMGSKAFTSLPRSVLYCIADPTEDGTFLFTHEKCNVGIKQRSITYRLASVQFELAPEDVDDGDDSCVFTSRVVWGEEDDRKAADVLAEAQAGKNLGTLRKDVREYIDAASGVVPSTELIVEFEGTDVTRANLDQTLKRMVAKGEIDKMGRGLYQSVKHRPKEAI